MPKITVFTRTTCAPCKTVKYFIEKKGFSFIEKNIDDPEYAKEFSHFADMPMVPLVLIGDQKVQGLNLARLNDLLMV
ncbi:glutaredoxin family protein [bacterium]|nr:glutaredoxin family protein [bacterium]NDC95636.1 glutaredoxin family protein [bacterium]NDD85245.1 glutaredoxin family protein [bacterium]NDG32651.1 glutaredoxin family protein [bacterium]